MDKENPWCAVKMGAYAAVIFSHFNPRLLKVMTEQAAVPENQPDCDI